MITDVYELSEELRMAAVVEVVSRHASEARFGDYEGVL